MDAWDNVKKLLWFGTPNTPTILTGEESKKNLSRSVLPIKMARIKQDTKSWREAVDEMERPFNPFRVKQQQMFIDTILNTHVKACMERRKDLTMLRDWEIYGLNGDTNENVEKLLDAPWFNRFISHSLDALFFGYSLIELGDVTNDQFKGIKVTKRWNVSPDRHVVSNLTYNLSGTPFLDEPWSDWHVYVSTPNEIGTSECGYGILYEVALCEIFLRNLLGFNGDYIELFAQPIRVGKTSKIEEAERTNFELALQQMGSSSYILLDAMSDEIELVESSNSGTAWKSYENFEQRLQKSISKVILGHADALDSTAGKLGATQGKESETFQAMEDKQSKDGYFITDLVNSELLPRMRKLGFNIPEDVVFQFKNNHEKHEHNDRVIRQAVEIKKAGLQIDKDYFEEQTGIKLFDLPAIDSSPAVTQSKDENTLSVAAKLKNIYK